MESKIVLELNSVYVFRVSLDLYEVRIKIRHKFFSVVESSYKLPCLAKARAIYLESDKGIKQNQEWHARINNWVSIPDLSCQGMLDIL